MPRAYLLLVALSAAALAGCDKKDEDVVKTTSTGETNMSASSDSATARGNSFVRVVNVGNGGKDVSIRLGDSALFNDVKSASVTDYVEVGANMARFSARTSGAMDSTVIAENQEVLMNGNRYTVFLISEDLSRNTLRVVKDDIMPDSGMARIRVIHAAPGAPELDIRAENGTESLFTDVSFKSEAGYKDVMPASLQLEVRARGETKVLLRLPRMDLKQGTATTIVITGASKLSAFQFTDAAMGPVAKM